jgi:hypothetical protein
VNLVAELVRGMRVDDALMQLAVSTKRAAKVVAKVVHLLVNLWNLSFFLNLSTLESWFHMEMGSGLVFEGMYGLSELNICQTKSLVYAGHDFCSCQCHAQPWFGQGQTHCW